MRSDSLSTQRLLLRPYTLKDVEPLFRIVNNPAVHRYMPRTDPWPMDKARKWIELGMTHWAERGYGWWAVELHASGLLAGWCGLNYLDETDEIEVLYLIAEEQWGKGLATEAALATVEHAFNTVGLEYLVGIVHPENIASRRVLDKIGMTHKGKAQYFGIEVDTYFIEHFPGNSGPKG